MKQLMQQTAMAAIVGFACTAGAEATLLNGGFDDNGGSMDNWTVVDANGATWGAETSRGQIGGPESGTHFAINNQDGAGAYFYQSFATTGGTTYDLSFYTARPQTNNNNVAIEVDVFDGSGDPGGTGNDGGLLDESIVDGDIGLDPEWVLFTYQFTAASSQTTLRFLDPGTSGVDPAIDSVTVSQIPEPLSMILLLIGFGSALALRRR